MSSQPTGTHLAMPGHPGRSFGSCMEPGTSTFLVASSHKGEMVLLPENYLEDIRTLLKQRNQDIK